MLRIYFALTVWLICFSVNSQAGKNHPDFSYEDARNAFATASPPTPLNLKGEWTLIGRAFTQQTLDSGASGIYYPDGKYPSSWYGGYNKDTLTISSRGNAFGKERFCSKEREVGAETGKIYYEESPASCGTLTKAGYVVEYPSNAPFCAGKLVCRIVTSVNMLLCDFQSTDTSRACQYALNKPFRIVGYKKFSSILP